MSVSYNLVWTVLRNIFKKGFYVLDKWRLYGKLLKDAHINAKASILPCPYFPSLLKETTFLCWCSLYWLYWYLAPIPASNHHYKYNLIWLWETLLFVLLTRVTVDEKIDTALISVCYIWSYFQQVVRVTQRKDRKHGETAGLPLSKGTGMTKWH